MEKDQIGISLVHLKRNLEKSIQMINKKSYSNIFNYAYTVSSKSKNGIKNGVSTWRKIPPNYKTD